MMLRQATGLCERTMLRTNKTEAQHVAYKKRLQKPVKMFCMLLTHKPRAPRGFRAEHERSTELLERSQAKNSLLVRDEPSTSRGVCSHSIATSGNIIPWRSVISSHSSIPSCRSIPS